MDWYPWGDEALARARDEDRPLLVSIGYSACHWCHVMERESFEDPAVAAVMNEQFVCVKVDREERPDVDAIYMDALQAMTGHGGWPLNAFLAPDGIPFYAGTYYPPQPRQGMPSWRQVLEGVAHAWREQREEIEEAVAADPPAAARRRDARAAGRRRRPGLAGRRGRHAAAVYDAEHGGWGGAPKFPHASVIEFLLRRGRARDGAAHAAPDGGRRHVRPGRRRLLALQRRRALDRPPLREDALRQRAARPRVPARLAGLRRAAVPARVRRDARLGAARAAPGRGRLRLRARRGLGGRARASSTSGRPTRCARRCPPTSRRPRSSTSGSPSRATSRAAASPCAPRPTPSGSTRSRPACSRRASGACGPGSTTSGSRRGTR